MTFAVPSSLPASLCIRMHLRAIYKKIPSLQKQSWKVRAKFYGPMLVIRQHNRQPIFYKYRQALTISFGLSLSGLYLDNMGAIIARRASSGRLGTTANTLV